jgi:hypothetical protein
MKRILSGIALLPYLCAHAQTQAVEPAAESNPLGMIIFGVLFLGFCLGFVWMVWRNQGKEKKE